MIAADLSIRPGLLTIAGIGTAVPTQSISQREAAALAAQLCDANSDEQRSIAALYRRTRVSRRGSVLLEEPGPAEERQSFFLPAAHAGDMGPGTAERMQRYAREAPPLAIEACQSALRSSGVAAGQITHFITVSCTGFAAPGVDIALIQDLGLPPGVQRSHVGFMGCHGALNGLRIAGAFTTAEADARVLLCAVELCSLHFNYGSGSDTHVANALFSDGAAALVGVCGGIRSGQVWQLVQTGSCLFPDADDAMTWSVGDHGFEMTLSARVPELIAAHLRPWLGQWLATAGLAIEDVPSWAVHPGGPRVLSAVAASLQIGESAMAESFAVLSEHGNMSSPTILFILQRLIAQTAPRPCVALAFGPGLAVEAALFR